jgi:hypothetical protein
LITTTESSSSEEEEEYAMTSGEGVEDEEEEEEEEKGKKELLVGGAVVGRRLPATPCSCRLQALDGAERKDEAPFTSSRRRRTSLPRGGCRMVTLQEADEDGMQ